MSQIYDFSTVAPRVRPLYPMNTKRNFIFLVVLLILGISAVLTWAPWLSDEEVQGIVRADQDFKRQHPAGSDQANHYYD